MSTDDFKTRVERIAASLKVRNCTSEDDDTWSRWLLVHNPASQDQYTCSWTWVVQGPCSLIVTGDLGTMVFERPGGIGLNFAAGGLEYVAEKCAAGEVWSYDSDKARADLMAELQDMLAEEVSEGNSDSVDEVRSLISDADDIDFDDDRAAHEWWYEHVCSDDIPNFGRVPSSDLTRALACFKAVRDYEEATNPITQVVHHD